MMAIKRDGNKVFFDPNKIKIAVSKATQEVYHYDDMIDKISQKALDGTLSALNNLKTFEYPVETIQDIVEDVLMDIDHNVAKAYIRYRFKHQLARNSYTELMETLNNKISGKNIVNQNANVDEHSFGGRYGETADLLTKRLALEYYVSPKARENHEGNMIYIHDLSAYCVGMHNCLSIPFDDLLANGFNTRQTDVRPAQSINTAFQLVAVIFQLQSLNQFGGVSATHLDWTLVRYVRKSLFKHYLIEYLKNVEVFHSLDIESMTLEELDEWVDTNKNKYLAEFGLTEEDFFFGSEKLDKRYYQRALFETKRETYQAVEGMYHNLNTLQSRSGNQLPFTSINYGTCTLPEGRLIIRALLDVSIKGIGKLHKTSIFPCGIFQSMKDVNRKPGDPNYDLFQLALKSTSLRLYPNYANVEWSGNAGFDRNDPKTYFSTMGKCKCSSCKTF